ncbi:uncharacterized protein BXZ73DRAFT_103777 [Epithele typhae]|uniref:uncharacterized protein n=1 Tax=Epithele typhae TaxID=378194 RepID=UPI0020087098|nr:uncharacterized protein BXZ73DRAFT_103777 [Epithele typhae]KAH9923730.1 hypothetical protein BXZ73DRAFT_103777 [Epithele typhae]
MAAPDTLPSSMFAESIPAADYASLHDSIAPINRVFPPEILSEALSYCWEDMRSVRLTHVCRYWRAVALKTPRLWADAVAAPGNQLTFNKARVAAQFQDLENNRISFAVAALERSSPSPLRLKIHFLPDALSHTFMSHTARLVDLYVRLDSAKQLGSLCRILANGVPNLTVLGIAFIGTTGLYHDWLAPGVGSYQHDIENPYDQETLSQELTAWGSSVRGTIADTPRLHTLRCLPIDLLPHFACRTLRDICITPAVFKRCHLEGFVDALRRCPDLVQIHLCMINPVLIPQDDTSGWVSQSVDLPSLRTLVLNVDTEVVLERFLDFFSLEHTVTLNIVQRTSSIARTFEHLRSRHKALIQAQVRTATALRIRDYYDQWKNPKTDVATLADGADRVRYTLYAADNDGPPSLEAFDLIALFRPNGALLTHLVLHKIRDIPPAADAFRAFPRLASLDLAGPRTTVFLKALRHRPDDEVDCDDLVCPRLKTLAVSFGLGPGDDQPLARKACTALRARQTGWEATALRANAPRVAALAKTLKHRAARGLRLERLEWRHREWDASLGLGFPPGAVVGKYEPDPALYDQAELERLVDGPVVFGGFTYRK